MRLSVSVRAEKDLKRGLWRTSNKEETKRRPEISTMETGNFPWPCNVEATVRRVGNKWLV